MMNVCELHEKIAMAEVVAQQIVEQKLKDEAVHFVTKVIEPLIDNLTKMPNDYFIGYYTYDNLYATLSKERTRKTARGYVKYERYFENILFMGMDMVNFDYVNALLAPFGFVITTETKTIVTTRYTSSTPSAKQTVTKLYLNTLCSLT